MEKDRSRVPVSKADVEMALRLAAKLMVVLQKRGKGPVSCYLALKVLAIDMEENFGIAMSLEDDQELRDLLRLMDGKMSHG